MHDLKRPSFQFYPADWRKDANLRRCSPAARGVWMDVLCVLHDSDTYGIVTWPLKELASAAGASVTYLRELVEKRVLKGCDKGECEALIFTPRHGRKLGPSVTLVAPQIGPIWFSARFVRDEYVRTIRGEASRFGEAPDDAPIPPIGDGPSSATASSPSGDSEANASAADAAAGEAVNTKADLWKAAVAVLQAGGCEVEAVCRSFMGKLVGDYTFEIVRDAVAAAASAQPADAREYLKATCMRLNGERAADHGKPLTVPSNGAALTQAALAERARRAAEIDAEDTPEKRAARAAQLRETRSRLKAAA